MSVNSRETIGLVFDNPNSILMTFSKDVNFEIIKTQRVCDGLVVEEKYYWVESSETVVLGSKYCFIKSEILCIQLKIKLIKPFVLCGTLCRYVKADWKQSEKAVAIDQKGQKVC